MNSAEKLKDVLHPQWHYLSADKAAFICDRDGSSISGFVVTNNKTGEIAIIDKSAVRWLSSDEMWWLMHDSQSPLNKEAINE